MAEDRVQRRLAAILAADVAGYSRLMEMDEAGTLARLKSLQTGLINPRIAKDGGRVVKTMGDGVLVEFGSAVDAVRNALSIQEAMHDHNDDAPANQRIEFRIGVNLGDLIVDGDDIHGDGVNVASRLEGLCEPGAVFVSGSVYDQVSGKLNASFDDLGEQSVKNIARPVRVYRARGKTGEAATPAETGAALPLPDKPSIAVLPFTNISGDPEQEYFVDGMTEDLITDLSKVSGLFVIARNSSFVYKGKQTDLRRVGRELGVRNVLEGSVRKAGNRVRINAQLIDAASGGHLWADRYDGDMDDIFSLQDEITARIVSALRVSLGESERQRTDRKPTEDMEAYDLFLRGRAAMYPPSRESNVRARDLLEKSVQRDPNFAEAHAILAHMYLHAWIFGWSDELTIERALETANRAVALDDNLAIAHARLGWIQTINGNHDSAFRELKRAIASDPGDGDGHHWLGETLNFMGDPEGAIESTKEAMRLSPHLHGAHLGHSNYLLRRYDVAIATLKEGIARGPGFPMNYVYLAAVYGELGRIDEARAEVANARDVFPDLTLEVARQRIAPYRRQSDADRLIDNLRKAGLPD